MKSKSIPTIFQSIFRLILTICLTGKVMYAQPVSTAERFNERGYSTTASSILDDNEIIGEYDGNLSLVYSTKYELPNDLDYNLTLTYNANVGHNVFNKNIGNVRFTGYPVNKPVWIIGVKDIAIQTTNFEVNFYMLDVLRQLYGEEVPYLIPGYHYTNRTVALGFQEGYIENDYIQILKADGSLLMLYNKAANTRIGKYVETNPEGYGYANVQYIQNSPLRRMWYKPGDGLTYYFEEEAVHYSGRDWNPSNDLNPRVMYLKNISNSNCDTLSFYYAHGEFNNGQELGRKLCKSININKNIFYQNTIDPEKVVTSIHYVWENIIEGMDITGLRLEHRFNLTQTEIIFQFGTGSKVFDTGMAGQSKYTKTKFVRDIIDELGRTNRIHYYTLPSDPSFELYRKYKYYEDGVNPENCTFISGAYLPWKIEYYNGKETILTYKDRGTDRYEFLFVGRDGCGGTFNYSNYITLKATYRDDFTNYMVEKRELFDAYPSLHKVQNEEYYYVWGDGNNSTYSICDSPVDNIYTRITRTKYAGGNSSPTTIHITKNFSKYLVSYKPDAINDYSSGVIRLKYESISDGVNHTIKSNQWVTESNYGNMYWLVSETTQISDGSTSSSKTTEFEYETISSTCFNKKIKTKVTIIAPQDLKKEIIYENFIPQNENDIAGYFRLGMMKEEKVLNVSGSLTKSHIINSYVTTGENIGKLDLTQINVHDRSSSINYEYYSKEDGQTRNDTVYTGFLKSQISSNGLRTNYYYPKCDPYYWGVLKYYMISDTVYGYYNTNNGQRIYQSFITKSYQTKPFKTETIYNNVDTLKTYTSYDTRGNLKFEIDANRNYSEYKYDYGGRLLRANFPGSFYSEEQVLDTTYVLQNLNLVPNNLVSIGMKTFSQIKKAVYECDGIIVPDSPAEPEIEKEAEIEGDEDGGGGNPPPNPPSTRIYDFYLFFEEAVLLNNISTLNFAELYLRTTDSFLSPGQNKNLKLYGITQEFNSQQQTYETTGLLTFTFQDFSLQEINVVPIIQTCIATNKNLYGFKISATTLEVGELYRRFYFGDDNLLSISYTAFNAEQSNARSSILFAYDDLNNKVEMIKRFNHNPQNDTKILTKLEYDSFGQLRKTLVKNSSGLFDLKKETNYNYLGLKNDEKDAENRDLFYSYDYFSRLDTLYYDNASPTSPYQTSSYTPLNSGDQFELKTIKDEENKITKVYYLKNGLVDKEEKINGSSTLITDYNYDALQRLTEIIPPKGISYKTYFFYDELGNIRQRTSVDEGTVQFKYDKYNNLRFSLNLASPANDKSLMFTKYDQFNRPLATGLLPANAGFNNLNPDLDYSVNQSGYSHFENLNTDTANFVLVNMYDKFERTGIFSNLTNGYGSILANVKNVYNLRGKVVATAFRDKPGDAWSYKLYGYDILGRCRTMIVYFKSGSIYKTITNEYDNLGNLVKQVANNEFHYWYDYDEQGRLKYVWSSIHNAKTTARLDASYTYNKADQVAQLNYLLEEDSFLKQLYSYNNRGWVSSTSTELYQIIHGEETPVEAPPFFVENLSYYKNGNVNTQTITNFGNNNWPVINFTYSYDGMNRLTQSICSNTSLTQHFFYDENSNITKILPNGSGNNLHFWMESNKNRLDYLWVNDAGQTRDFIYDYRGNLTFDGYKGYSISDYDHRNLPLFMNRTVIDMRFSYDDAGLRIYKDISGEKEFYLRDHTGRELAVYNLNTTKLKMANIYGNGLIGKANVFWTENTCYDELGNPYTCYSREDDIYYYIKDHLGSIRATLSRDGEIVAAQDYLPYGEIIPGRSFSTGGLNEKYKFTEKERDDLTGYDYFGARYYDSELARWQTVDPLADKYPGWSSYNYCLNNPLKFIDPKGMYPLQSDADDPDGTKSKNIVEKAFDAISGFVDTFLGSSSDATSENENVSSSSNVQTLKKVNNVIEHVKEVAPNKLQNLHDKATLVSGTTAGGSLLTIGSPTTAGTFLAISEVSAWTATGSALGKFILTGESTDFEQFGYDFGTNVVGGLLNTIVKGSKNLTPENINYLEKVTSGVSNSFFWGIHPGF